MKYNITPAERDFWIRIEDLSRFLIKGELKKYHPDDPRHTPYWRELKRLCIEGRWFQDFNGWRYGPGRLLFYRHFCTIIDTDKKENVRRKIQPLIRDIEWHRAYYMLECSGFSGWTEDDKYTSDLRIFKVRKNYDTADILSMPELFTPNGKFKEYIDPRENIFMVHDQPKGLPMYWNPAKNHMELGSRGGGKSYWYSLAGAKYQMVFDGVKYYTKENRINPPKVEVLIGSGRADKSSEFCKKIEDSMNELATDNSKGAWGKHTDADHRPSPFYKDMKGSLEVNNKAKNNPWRHEYEKKINGRWIDGFGTGSLIYHVNYSPNKRDSAEAGAGGRYTEVYYEETGLCFAPLTKVRMYDGSIKFIQDIHKGDVVMGHDGSPRLVEDTTMGYDKMYEIDQTFGKPYTVNSKHRLCLYDKYNKAHGDNYYITNPVEFLKFSKAKQREQYGYKNECLNFDHQNTNLDPYFLGYWLGDESVKSQRITVDKSEVEVLNYLKDYYSLLNLDYSEYKNLRSSNVLTITGKKRSGKYNPMSEALRRDGVWYNKHIPIEYIHNSKTNRLKLLAGLIDSDGSYSSKGKGRYEITVQKRKQLAEQIQYLATTLGLRCVVSTRIRTKGYGGKKVTPRVQYRIRISGDIHQIPCLIPRKKCEAKSYMKNHLMTSIKVSYSHEGQYHGIVLKDNPLFLLADGTVVHNTEKVIDAHLSNRATVDTGKKFGSEYFLGTSGNMETIQPTKKIFTHPIDYKCLEFVDFREGSGKTAFFLPSYITNNEYKDKNGNTDLDAAIEHYNAEAAVAAESNDPNILRMYYMNWPMVISHMWQTNKGSILPAAEAEEVEKKLMKNNLYQKVGTPIKLFWSDQVQRGIDYEIDHQAQPFYEFPIESDSQRTSLDGAIMIYEFPRETNGTVPNDMYFITHDPYVSDEWDKGGSLGTAHVWLSPKYWDQLSTTGPLVASYIGKAKGGKKEYYQNLEKLLAFYGNPVRGLAYEANRGEYCRSYFVKRKKAHLLALRPQYQVGSNIYQRQVTQYGYIIGNKIQKIEKLDDLADFLLQELDYGDAKYPLITTMADIFTMRQIKMYDLDGNFDAVSSVMLAPIYIAELEHQLLNDKRGKNKRHNPLTFLSKNTKLFRHEENAYTS